MGPSKPKLLLLGEIEHEESREAWRALAPLGYDLIEPSATNPTDFLEECKGDRFEGVVAAYSTFGAAKTVGRMEGEVVQLLRERGCRFVCHCGAGYDQLSIPSLTAAGIRVSNTPGAVDASTADTALFLILGCLRNFNPSLVALRQGTFKGSPPPALGHDPAGKTLGILGMGGIGKTLARKASHALGMKVAYHNRRRLEASEEEAVGAKGGVEYLGFEELLKRADVLSVNLPLNPSTTHLLTLPHLSLLPKGAIVINTARGPIIDESALVTLLDTNHLSSVGLDVYEREPTVHPSLLKNEKTLLLPHMGTYTVETQVAMELLTIQNVKSAVVEGKGLVTPVGEQRDMK